MGYPGPIGVVLYDHRAEDWRAVEDGSKPWTSPQGQRIIPQGWSSDGRYLAIGASAGEVHVFDATAQRWLEPLSIPGLENALGVWSQHGHWVALQYTEKGEDQIHTSVQVLDVAAGRALGQIHSLGGLRVLWLSGPEF
ncbi:MAG: hypothetical protein ACOY94_03595 [Bacillota bacterium]